MSKAPIIILLTGIGATLAFGLMAHVAFSKSPTLQASTAYRQVALKRFPVSRTEIRLLEDHFELSLTVDGRRLPVPPTGRFERLPAEFSGVARDFREFFPVQLGAGRLRVRILEEPDFWGNERILWEHWSPSDLEVAEIERACAERLGEACKIELQAPNALRVSSAANRNMTAARDLLPVVAALDGGGWQRVEFAWGRLSFRFDGSGKRLP